MRQYSLFSSNFLFFVWYCIYNKDLLRNWARVHLHVINTGTCFCACSTRVFALVQHVFRMCSSRVFERVQHVFLHVFNLYFCMCSTCAPLHVFNTCLFAHNKHVFNMCLLASVQCVIPCMYKSLVNLQVIHCTNARVTLVYTRHVVSTWLPEPTWMFSSFSVVFSLIPSSPSSWASREANTGERAARMLRCTINFLQPRGH